MTRDEGWTRAAVARWFVHHDDVDEAARVLEPGDELLLGKSDYLDLAAALSRRGLSASYDCGRVSVLAPEVAQEDWGEAIAGLATGGLRKPPLRADPGVASTAAKKIA